METLEDDENITLDKAMHLPALPANDKLFNKSCKIKYLSSGWGIILIL